MTSIPTVVLAGGTARPELEAATGQRIRALIVVNGKTLLERVVDAVRTDDCVDSVTVMGDVPENPRYRKLPDQGDFVGNLFTGIECYADSPYVLLATSDLPFLTPSIVAGFLHDAVKRADDDNSGLVWPVVPVASCYARFPGVKRTALRLKEGELTGGNLMLVRPQFMLANREQIAEAFAARKSVGRLAAILGIPILVRLLLSQKVAPRFLSVTLLEARIGKRLGGKVAAILSQYPEIATDLDRASDFAAISTVA